MPIRALFAVLARRHAARVAEAHLATLPDHLLRDIGLSRGRIPEAVRGRGPSDSPAPVRPAPEERAIKKLHT